MVIARSIWICGTAGNSADWRLMKRAGITAQVGYRKPAAIFLITSKCFITANDGMVRAIRCHQLNTKTSIINDSEVSKLSVAIHDVSGVTNILAGRDDVGWGEGWCGGGWSTGGRS